MLVGITGELLVVKENTVVVMSVERRIEYGVDKFLKDTMNIKWEGVQGVNMRWRSVECLQ